LLAFMLGARRVVREHALRAPEVGDAHCGKQHAPQLFGWKRDRDPEHATEDSVLAQDVPERLALPQQPNVRLAQRDPVLSQADRTAGRPNFHRAQLGLIAAEVGGQEIKDVVLARIDAGLKGGPGDRREWRQGGAKRFETTLSAELGQMGELTLL